MARPLWAPRSRASNGFCSDAHILDIPVSNRTPGILCCRSAKSGNALAAFSRLRVAAEACRPRGNVLNRRQPRVGQIEPRAASEERSIPVRVQWVGILRVWDARRCRRRCRRWAVHRQNSYRDVPEEPNDGCDEPAELPPSSQATADECEWPNDRTWRERRETSWNRALLSPLRPVLSR